MHLITTDYKPGKSIVIGMESEVLTVQKHFLTTRLRCDRYKGIELTCKIQCYRV